MAKQDDHLDTERIEDALAGEDPIVVDNTPPEKVDAETSTPSESKPEPEPASPSADGPDPDYIDPVTGKRNPLKLKLTECHLPQELVDNRKKLLQYVGQYWSKDIMPEINMTGDELQLYERYRGMLRSSHGRNRPVIKRTFAAAVRLIGAGKPIERPEEKTINELAL